MKKTALTPKLSLQWAQLAHAIYLDALMACADWSARQMVFHGGTSLHLSWRSARYSEDLDFLLSREVRNMAQVAPKVLERMREQFRAIDPAFIVQMQDKSKDPERMQVYVITISQRHVLGRAMVKAEFWRTDAHYLQNYPFEYRTPQPAQFVGQVFNRLISPVPAATLQTAYADKLTAFATRPRLKWRDIYDLWWIGTQSGTALEPALVAQQFLHNVQAYTTLQGLPPAQALRLFLQNDRAAIVAQADPDLKRWLPLNLWRTLHPDGVVQMVDYVFHALAEVAAIVDAQPAKDSGTNA